MSGRRKTLGLPVRFIQFEVTVDDYSSDAGVFVYFYHISLDGVIKGNIAFDKAFTENFDNLWFAGSRVLEGDVFCLHIDQLDEHAVDLNGFLEKGIFGLE